MNYSDFEKLVHDNERPVILIEGTRALPAEDREKLVSLAAALAKDFREAIFRTGNAEGSDEAFAEGVNSVDPARLQYVLPYPGHRKKKIPSTSYQFAGSEVSRVAEKHAVYVTNESSPKYATMLEKRDTVPSLKSKSQYIIRDTLKVTGADEEGLAPATVGIFHVNAADPMQGGTGHTIRVCQNQGVPTVFQDEWMNWQITPA